MKTKNAKSNRCGTSGRRLLPLLLTGLLLACCGCNPYRQASKQIYQPAILVLPPGVPLQTTEGTYLPQTLEVWHSDARYRAVERLAIDAAAALAQERSRTK
jgi:hypothetical protein